MYIDTHTHLYLEAFNEDRDEIVQKALDAGVKELYLPNVDSETIDALLALEAQYPKNCFAMMGLHPCSVNENVEQELALVKDWLDKRPFCAVGEIGLDYYWDKTFMDAQAYAFKTQTAWAKSLGLPIIIHSRDSTDAVIDILEEMKDEKLYGIFHCFGGTLEQAHRIVALGFKLGIGGVVTFKNGGLNKIIPDIDLADIVLETDAPYLTPTPYRGKRNESSYIPLIAHKIAEIKDVSIDEVKSVTTQNAHKVFKKR